MSSTDRSSGLWIRKQKAKALLTGPMRPPYDGSVFADLIFAKVDNPIPTTSIMVFGGFDWGYDSFWRNDNWVWAHDFNNAIVGITPAPVWTLQMPNTFVTHEESADAHQPTFRSGMTVVYNSDRQEFLLFGGYAYYCDDYFNSTNDLWTWKWNTFPTSSWTQIQDITNDTDFPAKRYDHAMIYDVSHQQYMLFGGFTYDSCCDNYRPSRDTWTLSSNGSAWEQLYLCPRPCRRFNHKMVYDPSVQKTLLFGGIS